MAKKWDERCTQVGRIESHLDSRRLFRWLKAACVVMLVGVCASCATSDRRTFDATKAEAELSESSLYIGMLLVEQHGSVGDTLTLSDLRRMATSDADQRLLGRVENLTRYVVLESVRIAAEYRELELVTVMVVAELRSSNGLLGRMRIKRNFEEGSDIGVTESVWVE